MDVCDGDDEPPVYRSFAADAEELFIESHVIQSPSASQESNGQEPLGCDANAASNVAEKSTSTHAADAHLLSAPPSSSAAPPDAPKLRPQELKKHDAFEDVGTFAARHARCVDEKDAKACIAVNTRHDSFDNEIDRLADEYATLKLENQKLRSQYTDQSVLSDEQKRFSRAIKAYKAGQSTSTLQLPARPEPTMPAMPGTSEGAAEGPASSELLSYKFLDLEGTEETAGTEAAPAHPSMRAGKRARSGHLALMSEPLQPAKQSSLPSDSTPSAEQQLKCQLSELIRAEKEEREALLQAFEENARTLKQLQAENRRLLLELASARER